MICDHRAVPGAAVELAMLLGSAGSMPYADSINNAGPLRSDINQSTTLSVSMPWQGLRFARAFEHTRLVLVCNLAQLQGPMHALRTSYTLLLHAQSMCCLQIARLLALL
jgi:hypothetical protein